MPSSDLSTPIAQSEVSNDVAFREQVAAILSMNGDPVAAWKFEQCGESGLGWVGTCTDCGEEVYHPATCDLRICPRCAHRRSATMVDRLSPEIEKVVKHSPDHLRLRHIVLTTDYSLLDYIDFDPDYNLFNLPRLAELTEIIRRLRIQIRIMFQQQFPSLGLLGGLIGTEFGPGGFRLHFHVLALCPYWPQVQLADEWREQTEGHGRWVWIEQVDDPKEATSNVVKYIVKEVARAGIGKESNRALTRATMEASERASQLGEAVITAAVHFVFKGVRRVQSFGTFYGLGKDDGIPCCCPLCGGRLLWQTEAEWAQGKAENADLFLKRANNFSGPDPPESAQPEQLGLIDAPTLYY